MTHPYHSKPVPTRCWCVACGQEFHAFRLEAKTCNARCRKRLSRSPAGALERLRRLGQIDNIKVQRKARADEAVLRKERHQQGEDRKTSLKLKPAKLP